MPHGDGWECGLGFASEEHSPFGFAQGWQEWLCHETKRKAGAG